MLRWSFNAKNVLKMFSFHTRARYELHVFSLLPGSEAWSWINLKNGQNYWQLHPEPDPNGHNNWWTGRLRAGQSVTDAGHGAFTWDSGGLTQKWWVQLPDWWVDPSSVSILWAFILNGPFAGGHKVDAPLLLCISLSHSSWNHFRPWKTQLSQTQWPNSPFVQAEYISVLASCDRAVKGGAHSCCRHRSSSFRACWSRVNQLCSHKSVSCDLLTISFGWQVEIPVMMCCRLFSWEAFSLCFPADCCLRV